MPQKEIRRPPCWWGSQTKMDGTKNCSNSKTFCVWMKKKSTVEVIWRTENNNCSPLTDQRSVCFVSRWPFSRSDYRRDLGRKCKISLRTQISQEVGFIHHIMPDYSSLSFSLHTKRKDEGLIFLYWRLIFAFAGIWFLNQWNKQAVEATAQSKQNRRLLRKAPEMLNLLFNSVCLDQTGHHSPPWHLECRCGLLS